MHTGTTKASATLQAGPFSHLQIASRAHGEAAGATHATRQRQRRACLRQAAHGTASLAGCAKRHVDVDSEGTERSDAELGGREHALTEIADPRA